MTFSLWFTSEPVISLPAVWYDAAILPITGKVADLPDEILLTISCPSVTEALSKEVITSPANTLRNRASSVPAVLILPTETGVAFAMLSLLWFIYAC